jgi:hypothetical protein
VAALFAEAQHLVMTFVDAPAEAPARQAARRHLMQKLAMACQPYVADEMAPQALLCRRIATQLDALCAFVLDPAVAATNNAAERSLRHPAAAWPQSLLRLPKPAHVSSTLNSYDGRVA